MLLIYIHCSSTSYTHIDLHIEYHYTIMLLIYIHCCSTSYTHIDLHIEYHYNIMLLIYIHCSSTSYTHNYRFTYRIPLYHYVINIHTLFKY